MKKNPLMLILCLLPLSFVGCTKVHTAEYYSEHKDEAKSTLIECDNKKNKGNMSDKDAENCTNATKGLMGSWMMKI